MPESDRKQRLMSLLERQNEVESYGCSSPMGTMLDMQSWDQVLNALKIQSLEMPDISWDSQEIETKLVSLKDMEEFDESVFAKWRTADIPVMCVAGVLGTLSSVALREWFADLHDAWGKAAPSEGGHSKDPIDWVPGNKQPGGFGHRWDYGHDLLNPFEVDWDYYLEVAKESGTVMPKWMKAVFYWVRHLFQDSFAKEGLPIPGHSLFREWLNAPANREILQYLGTIKARDIAGAGVTNLIMTGYIWGTEKSLKRATVEPNYRGFSLMLGANVVTLLGGLLVPPPATSFNWGTVPVIGYYSYQLIKLELKVKEALRKRDDLLRENDAILQDGFSTLRANDYLIDQVDSQLEEYGRWIDENYHATMEFHNELKDRIL